MSRIRTVKPEFWKHEALSALPAETHMLAAALLNYADDEGYFNANPKLVQSECAPLRESSVSVHDSLISLQKIGYLKLGTATDGRRFGCVTNFEEHQRINRATKSKFKGLQIAWDGSVIAHTQLSEDSPPEGNREQGTGKGKKIPPARADGPAENSASAHTQLSESAVHVEHPPVEIGRSETDLQRACRATWDAYAEAFAGRYGAQPQRDRTVNAQVKTFVQSVGFEDSPQVAVFYVGTNDAFVTKACHPFGMLLQARVKYRTEWITGRSSTTGVQARQQERTASNAAARIAAELRAQENSHVA